MLEKFVDELPIPQAAHPKFHKGNVTYYELEMSEFKQKLHRDLPDTAVWGFDGTYPGPTIKARFNEKIIIKWLNNLPKKHLFTVDYTLYGAHSSEPEVKTSIHLHGGRAKAESSGFPEAWFTNGFKHTGPFFRNHICEYSNIQSPCTMWYHDSSPGTSRFNLYAGLFGFYIIYNSAEESLNLPKETYDIPIAIQDKSFDNDGSLVYMNGVKSGLYMSSSILPAFYGNSILVNGKAWPYLEVEPRKYRFRILNASNSRFYRLKLSTGQPFYHIGTDQGLQEKPIMTQRITVSPGERADVILDFSGFPNQNILMQNDAPAPFPDGISPDTDNTGLIMQFRVGTETSGEDTSTIPDMFYQPRNNQQQSVSRVRNMNIVEDIDSLGRPLYLINNKRWNDPITEKIPLGTTEIWNIINTTIETLPVHMHMVKFKILDYRPFDIENFYSTGNIEFTAPAYLPEPIESGWKDTAKINTGTVTRLMITFTPFSGIFSWNCSMLERQDHEMMRPFEIIR